jgi:cytochrome o ubiquinol oxidase subunit IV
MGRPQAFNATASWPESTDNILALAFGVLIVFLVITGSVWIIANLNSNMMPMSVQ